MSAINDFLIKSAGMEKEAKRALFRALEKGITSFRNPQYTNSMSAIDLKTPLISRITNYLNRSRNTPVTEDAAREYISTLNSTQKRDLLKRMIGQSKDDALNAWNGPDNKLHLGTYVTNMTRYNPQLGKASRIYKKFLEPRPTMPLSNKQRELGEILFPTHRGLFERFEDFVNDASSTRLIPTITIHEAKVPFANTHHLANGPIGLTANSRARKAVAVDPTIQYIANLDPDEGWRNWRSDKFTVNIPDRPWTEEQLKLMRESKNLSNTPLYESVFTHGSKDYPSPTAVYVPDEKGIREILGIPDDVKSVHIDELQSPVQGILYKGRRDGSGFVNSFIDYYKNHPMDIRRAQDLTDFKLGRITQAMLADDKNRWFAPSARTAWSYARKPQKLIRLSGDQIGKLRKHAPTEQDMENYMRGLQKEIDNANPYDLKQAITSILAERKYDRDLTKIDNIIKTLSSRLNLPEGVIPHMLLA